MKDKVFKAEYIFPQLGKIFVPKIWENSHTDLIKSATNIVTKLLTAMRQTDFEKFRRELSKKTCDYCAYGSICDFECAVKREE